MVTFYLVRHGQKDSIPVDPALTPIGLKQAKQTAERLKDVKFHKIIASPKLRTRQTAECIAYYQSEQIHIDNRVVERLDWEGNESFEAFIHEWNKTDLDRSYQPKTGLSSRTNGERMQKLFQELSDDYVDGTILIVTHGGTIGDILRTIFTEKNVHHEIDSFSGASYIQISECSITIIQKNEEEYKLITVGDTSHLTI